MTKEKDVILNLFQDLIIPFIRLSLFVKYMRCRNKFGMTIWCGFGMTKIPSPLRGEGDAHASGEGENEESPRAGAFFVCSIGVH